MDGATVMSPAGVMRCSEHFWHWLRTYQQTPDNHTLQCGLTALSLSIFYRVYLQLKAATIVRHENKRTATLAGVCRTRQSECVSMFYCFNSDR